MWDGHRNTQLSASASAVNVSPQFEPTVNFDRLVLVINDTKDYHLPLKITNHPPLA